MEEILRRLLQDHYKVQNPSDLKSRRPRAKQIVVPRQIAMYLIKKFLDKSLSRYWQRLLEVKDHTTVMNAIERVEYLQSKDQDIFKDIEELD
jgi:chromosomal replication initiator protein